MRNALPTLLVLFGVGCAATPSGEVVVSDVLTGEIRRFDVASGMELSPFVHDLEAPSGLGMFHGQVVATDFADGRVVRLGSESRTLFTGDSLDVALEEPVAVADLGGRLAVLGNDTRNVVVLDPGADALDLAREPIRQAHGLAYTDGVLVVGTSPTVRGRGLLRTYAPEDGRLLSEFAPYGELEEATGLTAGPDGLYVSDWFTGRITRFDVHAQIPIEVVDEGLFRPVGCAFDAAGGRWVLTRHTLIDPDGEVVADDFEMGRGIVIP